MAKGFDAEKENAKQQKANEKQEKKDNKAKAKEIEAKAKATVDDAKKQVKAAEKAVDAAEDAIKQNNKNIEKWNKEQDKALEKLAELQAKQAEEIARLANMKSSGLYTPEQIAAQEATVAAAKAAVKAQEEDIAALQDKIAKAEADKDKLNQNLANAKENLEKAKANLEKAEQNYKDVKEEISNGTLEEAESLACKGQANCGTPTNEDTALANGKCPRCGTKLDKVYEEDKNPKNLTKSQAAALENEISSLEDKIASEEDSLIEMSTMGIAQSAINDQKKYIESLYNQLSTKRKQLSDAQNAQGGLSEDTEPTKYKCPQCGYEHDIPKDPVDEKGGEDSSVDVPEVDPYEEMLAEYYAGNAIAPFDVRLFRSDLFMFGADAVPFSSEEASGIMADLIEYQPGKDKNHAAPRNEKQYGIVSNDPNNYGLLSLINPYSTTRLYNGISVNLQGQTVSASENRMLDIRDQKRFYDIKKINDNNDPLTVSNPTTSNIIQIMCNDRWGRTPYTYQDFVFCKYWNRIPNNRLITLRKYAAATYDNLCWEMMGHDKDKNNTKFSPIATACTFFGGDSGNSLKDMFKIQSGLNWEEIGAEIWNVTGDSGESQAEVGDRIASNGGTNGMGGMGALTSMFNFTGKMVAAGGSLLKFLGAAKSPNVFSGDEANAQKFYENLHDPNDQGPYANRIKGPLNRIDKVMKRKEGIKFDHKITLRFSYKARPIGGVNTKAAMLDIMSNMLLLCSASAVFWGGGHRFMITPHAYPWHVPGGQGFMKAVYNGEIFGKNGAIAHVLKGVADVGASGDGTAFSLENVTNFLGKIGAGVLGAFGGAINALVGTLQGAGLSTMSQYVQKGQEWLNGKMGGNASFQQGMSAANNLIKNTQDVWKSNSVKQTVLPYVEGMRALLLGTPVGNWHLTVGNPLNPIAVIGNLICEDISFEFGEELGPDDFPDELDCVVTLAHGMPRDLAGIESMFNRGAGRIYQAPDYLKMWGTLPASEQETKVDALTGGTSVRVPHSFVAVEGKAKAGKYYKISEGKELTNAGAPNYNMQTINQNNVLDYNRGYNVEYTRVVSKIRATIAGNLHTRHYVDS